MTDFEALLPDPLPLPQSLKRAAGRPKDLEVLAELEAIEEDGL
jgi:hypothetical protein